MTMSKTTQRALVEDIATRVSESAYMSYAFDVSMYRSIARFLFAQGFEPAEVELVMNSKHIRWSYDSSDGRNISGATFKRYFERSEKHVRQMVEDSKNDGTVNFYRGRQSAFWNARKS